jgi:tetratricopeptide (TPR) repeat protein
MWEWYSKTNATVPVQGKESPAVLSFRVTREGKLMPILPETLTELPVPTAAELPAAAVAYPRHIVTDDRPTGEQTLSARFFERNPAHLIGRRTGNGVWPDDSENAEAVRLFETGQTALYQDKDVNGAITAYESAVERDSGYVKAWVALAIAYITDNTPESLDRATEVLTFLAGLEPSDWLTSEASGIIHQNRAYLSVHRFRQGGETDRSRLLAADRDYQICDARTGADRERLEYLCPWAYVKLSLGETESARTLWNRAVARAMTLGATGILAEYAAKYVPLRNLSEQ